MVDKFGIPNYLLILFLALFVTEACSIDSDSAEIQSSIEIEAPTATEEQRLFAQPATHTPPPTLIPTITPTATPWITSGVNNDFSWIEIIDSSTKGGIETVVWKPGSQGFYYAIPLDRDGEDYQWYEYDLASGNISELEEVLPQYRTNLFSDEFHNDLRSPSLRYEFITEILNPDITPFPESYERYDLRHWLIDTWTGERSLVMDSTIRPIAGAHWTTNEDRYVIFLGGEGIGFSAVADVGKQAEQASSATSISPDGNWLTTDPLGSAVGARLELRVLNITSSKEVLVTSEASWVSWAQNSGAIYYWDGQWVSTLTKYNVISGQKYELMDGRKLLDEDLCALWCYFRVSPDEKMAVLWKSGKMLLVTFNTIQVEIE